MAAVQQVNVYRVNVNLKSKQNAHDHLGQTVTVVGATPQIALNVVQQLYPGDLTGIQGAPILVSGTAGAFTTMSGT